LLETAVHHKLQLLEALAEEMARLTLEDFGAHWVRVVVEKPGKFEDVAAWRRHRAAARAASA
jgi:dihydroneopterin aldolase